MSPHPPWHRTGAMRDAEETRRFPDSASAIALPAQNPRQCHWYGFFLDSPTASPCAVPQHRFQTFFAMRRKVSGRNGKRSASPGYLRTTATTQNKKAKPHEKSKHSVQTNSRGSYPAAARLLCSSVYLGTYSGI